MTITKLEPELVAKLEKIPVPEIEAWLDSMNRSKNEPPKGSISSMLGAVQLHAAGIDVVAEIRRSRE